MHCQSRENECGRLVRQFLLDPNHNLSPDIFELCYRVSRNAVSFLLWHKSERRLDQSEKRECEEHTNDILGEFLGIYNSRQYGYLLESFEHGFGDGIYQADDSRLYRNLVATINRFVRQRIAVQSEQLQIYEAVNGAMKQGSHLTTGSGWQRRIHLNSSEDARTLPFENLLPLVYEALSESKNIPQLIERLFEMILLSSGMPNIIRIRDVVRAIHWVRRDNLEPTDGPCGLSEPERGIVRSTMNRAGEGCSELGRGYLDSQVEKGRLSVLQKDLLQDAMSNLVSDYAYDGQPDLLPRYVKELQQDIMDQDYQKIYKFPFDQAVARVLECIRTKFREDPTILQIWSYLSDGEGGG